MIKRKKKICKSCGKPEYIFSGGLCRQCWGLEQTLKNWASKAPRRPIRYKSEKRKEEEKEYKRICKEMDTVKPHMCFFCGWEIKGRVDHHHLKGKVGGDYLDKRYIVKAHRKCHSEFHSLPVDKMWWFDAFLFRLKQVDFDLFQKELRKRDNKFGYQQNN